MSYSAKMSCHNRVKNQRSAARMGITHTSDINAQEKKKKKKVREERTNR